MCRVGLLAGLVGASGMAADCPGLGQVVWLPVVEWVLGVLGWAWPWLGRTQRYRDVRTLVHAAYLMSVAGLGALAVRRWVTVGPAGMLLGVVVQCEWDDNRVELDSVYDLGLLSRCAFPAGLSPTTFIALT